MFFPLHWTILFNLSGIELYKFWMYSKGILSNSSWQNAQSSAIFLGYLWKTLFFSRRQTFSIILISGEFGGQFSRISNPFSENQVFERIELCAGALSCYNFPKNISGNRLSCKIWKSLIEFIVPQTFWRHFRPSWAIKPQSINFFPPNFRVSDKFFFSIPVLGKRRTSTRLLRCSSRVFRPKTAQFSRKFWEVKRFFCPNFSGKSVSCGKLGFFDSNSGTQMIGD